MKNTLNILLVIGLFSPITIFAAENAALSDMTQQTSNVHVRSLAASCAACHGTNGRAVPGSAANLAGVDKNLLGSKLKAFKSGTANATVMHRHAKGLSDEEIDALAEYFASQQAGVAIQLNSQKLRDDHGH